MDFLGNARMTLDSLIRISGGPNDKQVILLSRSIEQALIYLSQPQAQITGYLLGSVYYYNAETASLSALKESDQEIQVFWITQFTHCKRDVSSLLVNKCVDACGSYDAAKAKYQHLSVLAAFKSIDPTYPLLPTLQDFQKQLTHESESPFFTLLFNIQSSTTRSHDSKFYTATSTNILTGPKINWIAWKCAPMDLGVKEEDLHSPEVVQINRLYSVPEVIMDADVIRESQLSLMNTLTESRQSYISQSLVYPSTLMNMPSLARTHLDSSYDCFLLQFLMNTVGNAHARIDREYEGIIEMKHKVLKALKDRLDILTDGGNTSEEDVVKRVTELVEQKNIEFNSSKSPSNSDSIVSSTGKTPESTTNGIEDCEMQIEPIADAPKPIPSSLRSHIISILTKIINNPTPASKPPPIIPSTLHARPIIYLNEANNVDSIGPSLLLNKKKVGTKTGYAHYLLHGTHEKNQESTAYVSKKKQKLDREHDVEICKVLDVGVFGVDVGCKSPVKNLAGLVSEHEEDEGTLKKKKGKAGKKKEVMKADEIPELEVDKKEEPGEEIEAIEGDVKIEEVGN